MVQLAKPRTLNVDDAVSAAKSSIRVWGLTPRQLHDAFWRSKGVQCVRRGERVRLQRAAEVFLLIEPAQLLLFNIADLSDRLTWRDAALTHIRLLDEDQPRYSEHVITDERGLVQRIERRYRPPVEYATRVMLTSFRRIATAWMNARSRRDGCRRVRRLTAWTGIDHWRCAGRVYRGESPSDERKMLLDLVQRWNSPCLSIDGLEQCEPGVWNVQGERAAAGSVLVGPLWLGRGAAAQPIRMIGPGWVPDAAPDDHPDESLAIVKDIAEVDPPEMHGSSRLLAEGNLYPAIKRGMDIVGSLCALVLSLPIMIIVAVAILIDDGRPLFFGHSRQGRGGKIFRCWKFRTMRRNAHAMVHQLAVQNVCDGPQVYIRNDPRVTRVGKILRKANLDELPQFWNVLAGHMSLVGPRPSPDKENQFCPAWRDLRLSVRPGITGLWQLNRTRRKGSDFQEWIKYDIQYVQQASLSLDLRILLRTVKLLATGRS